MSIEKAKAFALVVVIVFIGAAGTQFLANAVNIFDVDLATWQVIINSGVTAVVTYIVAWLVPVEKIGFGLGS